MYNFSKYKEQYIKNLRLAVPIILSQVGHIIVQIADNAMVGLYGGDDATPLAAAAFGGGLFFLALMMVMGLTFGITPLIGEAFAQRKAHEKVVLLQNSILLYGSAAVAMITFLFATIPLIHYMGQPEEVIALAIPYYKTLIWSLFPVVIFYVFKQYLEGIGSTKTAMIIVLISNVVNIGFNYLLIGGEMGFPELGVYGAGIATLLSRCSLAVLIVCYFIFARRHLRDRKRFSRLNFSRESVRKLLKVGVPISMQITLEASSFVIIGFMFGWFTAEALSAYQSGVAIGNCGFMIIVAISSATTIRVSHCYGERDLEQMHLASKAAWHLALLWNAAIAIVFYSLRYELPRIFTTNTEVIELTATILVIISLYQIPDAVQYISTGILRGMQDVKYIPHIALSSYWLCSIPISYVCAFPLGMGPTGLYMGFFFGFSLAATLSIWRIYTRRKQLLLESNNH